MGKLSNSKHYKIKITDVLAGMVNDHPIRVLFCLILISFLFIYFPFVFRGKVFIYSDIGSDTENVYYPFFNLLQNKLDAGDFSLWTFDYGLGTNVLTRQVDTASVFTYLTLIFGKTHIKYSLIWVHFIKILLCGVLSYRFISYFGYSKEARIIGAYLYAFNGFIMLWGQHYFFGTASVCVILLLIAVEDTLQKKRCTCYIALAAACTLIISYYFAYMILASVAFYFVMRVIYIGIKEKRIYFKNLAWIVFSFFFAFLLSAFVFFPSVAIVLQNGNRITYSQGILSTIIKQAFSLSERGVFFTGLLRLFSNNLMGINEYIGALNYYEAPQYFMSSLNVFVFTLLFIEAVLSFREEKAKSITVLFTLLLVIYSALFKLFPVAFNGFVIEAYRYTFVLLPIFALGYSEVFNKIINQDLKYAKSEIVLSAGVSLCVLSVSFLLYGSKSNKAIATLIVCVMVIAMISLLSLCFNKNDVKKHINVLCTFFIIAGVVFNICFDGYLTAVKRNISSDVNYKSYTGHESDSVIKAVSDLKKSDSSFYRIEKSFYNVSCLYNDSLIEGYSGISAYDSVENKYVQEFVEIICPEMVYGPKTFYHSFINVKNNDAIISILGVKYVLSRSDQEYIDNKFLVLYKKIDDLYIYINTNTESIARMYYNTAKEPGDYSSSGIDIMNTLIINDSHKELSNEKSSVSIPSIYKASNNSSRVYGTVKAEDDGYLFLTIPYSEDWNAYVDGKQVKTMRADYGFIALKIGAGEHKIELKYTTPYLTIGIVISACSGVLLILFVFLKKALKRKHRYDNADNHIE